MTSPVETFSELGLSPQILQALTDVGYETPSPIQAQCIPILLQGKDLLGMAQTGTGKTAAFALPALQTVDVKLMKPQVLVLAPTRELAIQVAEAFQSYAKHIPGFHVLPIYGGQSYTIQLKQLARGAHVIVGTPGRVMDHLERKTLSLDNLKMLILDEADEMLRMGFIDDVEWILEHTPATRQTALFSATMPEQIRRVTQKYQRDPQEIKIKSATATVAAIRQCYWQVSGMHKLDALTRILEVEEGFDAALIFVRTKTATVELAEKLEARGYSAAALNGDLNQQMRERTIEQLKNGQLDIVIATDVAARGIDVSRVTHVINYDIPYDAEAYVHRIGRTGRAGRAGTAILFVAPREIRMLRTIERLTRQVIAPLTLPSRQAVTDKRISLFKQQVSDVIDAEDLSFFEDIVVSMEQEKNVGTHEIAAALAFLVQKERPLRPKEREAEPVRAERFERSERPAFDPKDSKARFERGAPRGDRPERSERPDRSERPERGEWTERPPREDRRPRAEGQDRSAGPAPGMATYRIEVGREHGVQPKNIVGAIANESGLPSRLIGRINLFDAHSTVDLPDDLSADIMQRLKRTWVCQQQLELAREGNVAASAERPERADRPERTDRPERSAGDGSRPPRKGPPAGGAKPWEGRGGDRGDRGERPERKSSGDRPPYGGSREGGAAKPKKPRSY